jgi:ATP-dependent Lon protease
MTGEITLRGRVLKIGGLKEKVIAAHRNKIKTVIIPAENEPELEEISKEILKDLEIVPVSTVDEVIKVALGTDGEDAKEAKAMPTPQKESKEEKVEKTGKKMPARGRVRPGVHRSA